VSSRDRHPTCTRLEISAVCLSVFRAAQISPANLSRNLARVGDRVSFQPPLLFTSLPRVALPTSSYSARRSSRKKYASLAAPEERGGPSGRSVRLRPCRCRRRLCVRALVVSLPGANFPPGVRRHVAGLRSRGESAGAVRTDRQGQTYDTARRATN
jgi:hypothetical protein